MNKWAPLTSLETALMKAERLKKILYSFLKKELPKMVEA